MVTRFEARRTPSCCRIVEVRVCGELDIAAAPRVQEKMRDALSLCPERLCVDLSPCTFLDAAGIRVLVDAHRLAWRQGTAFSLRGCTERHLRLIGLMGLDEVFDITPIAASGSRE